MNFGVTFCLITGASRGIGQQIGIQIASKIADGSVILLLSRTLSGLQDTKRKIEEVNGKVHVVLEAVDLERDISNEEYAGFINNAMKQTGKSASDFQTAQLFHNAVGLFPAFTKDLNDSSLIKKDMTLNYFESPVLLTTQFFKIFTDKTPKRFVIQISSLTSLLPSAQIAVYGALKAARNHFFRTLAVEQPTIQVLNYDPGLVETNLLRDFKNLFPKENDPAVVWSSMGYPTIQPSQTATALVEILEEGFESGSFINFTKDPKHHEMFKEKFEQWLKNGSDKK